MPSLLACQSNALYPPGGRRTTVEGEDQVAGAGSGSGVGASVLLRQPHGFESLPLVSEEGHPNDLPVAKQDVPGEEEIDWESADSADLLLMKPHEDAIAHSSDPLHVDPHIAPCREPCAPEVADPFGAEVHPNEILVLPLHASGVEHDALVEQHGACLQVSPIGEGIEQSPHGLHVPLRHRPRSIPVHCLGCGIARISFRQLGVSAIFLFVLVGVAQVTLPCHVWQWPAAVLFVVTGTLALVVIGTEERRPQADPTARGVAIWLSQAWIVSGIVAASGVLC